ARRRGRRRAGRPLRRRAVRLHGGTSHRRGLPDLFGCADDRERAKSKSDLPVAGAGMPDRKAFLSGLLTNLLNPKMVTFTIAFLPQFIDPRHGQVWLQFVILGAILIVLEFVVDGTDGVLAGRIGGWLRRSHTVRRRVETATGTLFIGLGVRLAVDR